LCSVLIFVSMLFVRISNGWNQIRRVNKLMDRRDFIKTTGTAMAAMTLPAVALAAEKPVPSGRSILPLNRNWRFSPAKIDGAHLPDFDDSAF